MAAEDDELDLRAGEGPDGFAESEPDGSPGNEPVRLPIEPVLDLHSFLPAEVESVVQEYLEEAYRAGFEEVRIIHGRGIGVQREIVRAVLSRTPWVISFRDARPEGGGWGATVALLARP
jgi:dsDNA-specific endonuclease/ATPase MutS2